MFTGIVEEVGTVLAADDRDGSRLLHVGCRTVVERVAIGDSISVDGCCLTVTTLPDDGFTAELMAGTLATTALGALVVGDRVNLERAMRVDARLGGHLVQGHVDGVGEVVAVERRAGDWILVVDVPAALRRYTVDKGSLTVQGVSLTVAGVAPDGRVRIGLIPHTREVTTLGDLSVGDRVNLEADVIAKYVERLLTHGVSSPYIPPGAQEVE